jgi:hypothetical protein
MAAKGYWDAFQEEKKAVRVMCWSTRIVIGIWLYSAQVLRLVLLSNRT